MHSMSDMSLNEIAPLLDRLAVEMIFAQAGKDDGLLPVNSLLTELQEHASLTGGTNGGDPPPPAISESVVMARSWVDAALESGAFSAVCLSRLGAWIQWLKTALQAAESRQALPKFPETFFDAGPEVLPEKSPNERPVEEIATLDLESNIELLREFVGEAKEHLQQIELGVLTLEESPTDEQTLNSIFRGFHSLKGGSGFLNLAPVNRLAHELESLLDLARQHKLHITSETTDLILCGADALKSFMGSVERQVAGAEPPAPIRLPLRELLTRLARATGNGNDSAVPAGDEQPGNSTPNPAPAPAPNKAAPEPVNGTQEAASKPGGGSVKVDTAKLDSLVDLVGEMVIAQAQVAQDPALSEVRSQQLVRNLAQLRRITTDLQRVSMSLRMVPIRSTFQKMIRLVRDLSAKAGKHVDLRMSGEETELDRNIIEELNDPLLHMIRNAVDHGIEKTEMRVAAGKPPRGEVQLRAYHEGGNVVIEVKDDGAGLNAERIRAKAIERKLIEEGAQLSEGDIFKLIFAPGFSTAETITDISGRGVGMDVVRRNIDKLRGKIEISSTPGKGSTFSIYLPLTLAIIDGLLVSVGPERYILPTLSVLESFRPSSEMLSTIQSRGEMVNVRGQIRPLLRLHDYFGVTPETTDPTQAIVVVVESEGQRRCLLVDRLLGKQEVVIKGLGETFQSARGLTGATILGDGRVGLILDVNSLVKLGNTKVLQE